LEFLGHDGVASHTLPIWSTRRAWKLLVHSLVIAVMPLWWWAWWRVEGLLVILVVVILTSVIGMLVLVYCCYSSLQSLNSTKDSSNGVFHLLKSHVSGLLVLCEKLGHHLHHGANLFVANAFFYFVSCCCWWWRGGVVVPILVAW
jgi:hypothetical protein